MTPRSRPDLVASPLAAQLEELDFGQAYFDDDAARLVAPHLGRFPRLTGLSVPITVDDSIFAGHKLAP